MIEQIDQWIDDTLNTFNDQKKCCSCLVSQFDGFYSENFLSGSSFCIVDSLPKPDFPQLRSAGFGSFIDMDASGITYKNTYFIKKGNENSLRLHFHELVHVLQWNNLGSNRFIQRYMEEILKFGYENAPLEIMAYSLDAQYANQCASFSVEEYVETHL